MSTDAFQVVAARLLGPSQYGVLASMMALLMGPSVVQFGLQATAARRISAAPANVTAIRQTVLVVLDRRADAAALGLHGARLKTLHCHRGVPPPDSRSQCR